MRRLTVFAFLPILLSLGGCNIYACVYETRFVSVQGTGTPPGGGTVVVESMGFRQYRPEQPVSNSVSHVVRGEGLAAAPTRLTLRDNRDPSRVVAVLSMQTSPVSFTAGSSFDVASSDRDRMFELLASGNARLLLELANDATLIVPLTVQTREDWHRPNCS
jgi:hypothetical protein